MSLSSVKLPLLNAPKGPDFPAGFIIEELEGAKEKVVLAGNAMPKNKLPYGGKQRIKKDFYSGHSEPVMQILGPAENDMTIVGELKDKRFKVEGPGSVSVPFGTSISEEFAKQIDAIRIRGNLCVFTIGQWRRYGFIEESNFELERLQKIMYEIKLSIVGFNAPKNARFLEKKREVPFSINKNLIAQAAIFQEDNSNIPTTVTVDIADIIDAVTNFVAGAINTLTSFVDDVISTTNDIRKSVERAKGLIKFTQLKLKDYKRTLGALDPFDANQSITGQYQNAEFYSSSISKASALSSLLNKFRDQFNDLADNLPLARHVVKEGETLQKISIEYYGTSDNWKEIFDYNRLTTTNIEALTVLEIPRV
jgi:nucleoid-associated protein YgaU